MIKIKESKALKICLHFLSEPRRLYVQMLALHYSEIPKNEQQTDNNNKLRKGIADLLNRAELTNKAMIFSLESFDPFLEQVVAARVFLLNGSSENSAVTKRAPKDINQYNKDLISLDNFLNIFNALILRNETTRQKIDLLRNTLIWTSSALDKLIGKSDGKLKSFFSFFILH